MGQDTRLLAGLFRWDRDSEPGPALRPPALEDIASARRRHPGEKPVRADAPSIVGLIGPFHLSRPTSTSLTLVIKFRRWLPHSDGGRAAVPNAPSNHTPPLR